MCVSSQVVMAERSYVCPSLATTGSLWTLIAGLVSSGQQTHKQRRRISPPHPLIMSSPPPSHHGTHLRICAVMGHWNSSLMRPRTTTGRDRCGGCAMGMTADCLLPPDRLPKPPPTVNGPGLGPARVRLSWCVVRGKIRSDSFVRGGRIRVGRARRRLEATGLRGLCRGYVECEEFMRQPGGAVNQNGLFPRRQIPPRVDPQPGCRCGCWPCRRGVPNAPSCSARGGRLSDRGLD